MTLNNKTLVICILARDCEKAIIKNIPLVEELRLKFKFTEVVVVENDSKDNTKKVLFDWSNNYKNVTIISKDFNTETIPNKTTSGVSPFASIYRNEKMSYYRNIYLDYIDDKKFDYLIAIDIDISWFSINGIIDALENAPENWGCIFANGITKLNFLGITMHKMHHDLYAFLEKLPNKKPYITDDIMFYNKRNILKKLKKTNYLPVISGFGGLGIYNFNAINGLRYRAEINGDVFIESLPEHLPFNLDIINRGYKNFIYNSLIVIYGQSSLKMFFRILFPNVFNFIASIKKKLKK